MKVPHRNTASVLVYIIILVNVALIMAAVVAGNTFLLESNYTFSNNNKALLAGVIGKSNLSVKYSNFLNSNGNGFIDVIGCPNSVTLSGSVHYSVTSSNLSYSGGIFCTGIHNAKEYKIYFNTGFTDFSQASYDGSSILLSGKTGTFFDTDSTYIDFSSYVNFPDNIDDDFDNDDYLVTSSGSYYPGNYSDDDTDARKTLYGYVSPNTGFKNIFWSNTQIKEYIEDNSHNSDTLSSKLGTGTGHFMLDVDRDFELKVVEFDKSEYDTTGELITVDQTISFNASGSVGYIQDNLTLSGNMTGNEYNFDLLNKDYAIFLQNTGTGVLFYKLIGQDTTGSGMYINPIDDTFEDIIKVLGYEVLDIDGKYVGKILEMLGKKE